jgi:hypothetical protein
MFRYKAVLIISVLFMVAGAAFAADIPSLT